VSIHAQTRKDSSLNVPSAKSDTSLLNDSTSATSGKVDSVKVVKKKKKSDIQSPVKYSANDSLIFDMGSQKVRMYKGAVIDYTDIELKADDIDFDMVKQTVQAQGALDSAGKIKGKPVFKEGSETFNAENLTYNFKTKKGYILHVRTEQDGGFLHADITKRQPNGNIDLMYGKYTTCDLEHPHFYLRLSKARSIPNDKIISGPAYIVVEDIPLPIGVPFGFFPNTKGGKSGVLIPMYGESASKGFFLTGGGYYLAISEKCDLRVTFDYYTKGTWGIELASNYKLRYKFSGNFDFKYFYDYDGFPAPPRSGSNLYSLIWTQTQDPKANPNRSFTANINYSSTTYATKYSYSVSNAQTNIKSSSISFSQRWPNSPFNLTATFRHSQNSIDSSVSVDFPSVTFNMNTIYPLRKKNKSGKMKWWENIQLSYSSSLDNQINTKDSLLFTKHVFDNLENGFNQTIPLSTNIKVGTMFNITPNINYNSVITSKYIYYEYMDSDKVHNTIVTHKLETNGFRYAQALAPGITLTLNPKFYGMYTFRGKKLKAIRHMMTPTLSYNLVPDLSGEHSQPPSYYKYVYDSITKQNSNTKYSLFDNSLVTAPRPSNGKSMTISYGITNKLEMKLLTKNDTSEVVKKIPLLENCDINGSFNPYLDSMNFSNLTFNIGTRLFENKYEIRLNGVLDPYYYQPIYENSTLVGYQRTKYLAIDNNLSSFSLGKITSYSLSISTRFQSSQKKKTSNTSSTDNQNYNKGYANFDIPWSLNISYSYGYNNFSQRSVLYNNLVTNQSAIVQTMTLTGDISFTKKWKLGFSSGYDFTNNKFSSTTLNFYRDLHCWEMKLMIVPYGPMQMYTFTINVKSALLHDVKYEKKKLPYDNTAF